MAPSSHCSPSWLWMMPSPQEGRREREEEEEKKAKEEEEEAEGLGWREEALKREEDERELKTRVGEKTEEEEEEEDTTHWQGRQQGPRHTQKDPPAGAAGSQSQALRHWSSPTVQVGRALEEEDFAEEEGGGRGGW